MPTVPNSNVVALRQPQMPKIPETFLLMAAADMHERGQLVETMPDPTQDSNYESLKGVESQIEREHTTLHEVDEDTAVTENRREDREKVQGI